MCKKSPSPRLPATAAAIETITNRIESFSVQCWKRSRKPMSPYVLRERAAIGFAIDVLFQAGLIVEAERAALIAEMDCAEHSGSPYPVKCEACNGVVPQSMSVTVGNSDTATFTFCDHCRTLHT
jgi:hypothetical protein